VAQMEHFPAPMFGCISYHKTINREQIDCP
jgi:hypothetical protein